MIVREHYSLYIGIAIYVSFSLSDYTDSPVWCPEGKYVELGDRYILCPYVDIIALHTKPEDIPTVDYVPPSC